MELSFTEAMDTEANERGSFLALKDFMVTEVCAFVIPVMPAKKKAAIKANRQ